MDRVELLEVEERFQLPHATVVLIPDFPVPPHGQWHNLTETVVLITPAGDECEFTANFSLWHFYFEDPKTDLSRRWRIVTTLSPATREAVPIGSKLWVTPATRHVLLEGVE